MSTTRATRRVCYAAVGVAVTLAAAWTLAAPGCEEPATAPPTRASTPQPVDIAPTADADTPAAAPADLVGLHINAWHYLVVEGDRQGEVVRVELTQAADPDDQRVPLRRRRADGRVEHLGVADDGAVVLGAVEDPDDGVITRYEPPLTLVPADLPRDSPQVFEAEMTVRNLEPPHRVRGSGDATRTITYTGDDIIESPVGDFRARRIEASFRGEMSLATVTIDATEWYSPEVGLIREAVDERVRAALLFGRDRQRTITLENLPDARADTPDARP